MRRNPSNGAAFPFGHSRRRTSERGSGEVCANGVRVLALFVVLLAIFAAGCASDRKAKYSPDRKWYQSAMDDDDRAFYLKTLFGGR